MPELHREFHLPLEDRVRTADTLMQLWPEEYPVGQMLVRRIARPNANEMARAALASDALLNRVLEKLLPEYYKDIRPDMPRVTNYSHQVSTIFEQIGSRIDLSEVGKLCVARHIGIEPTLLGDKVAPPANYYSSHPTLPGI